MSHKSFFDQIAERWDDMERKDIGERIARVVAESDVHPGDHILDVGTGTGVLIPHLLTGIGDQGHILAIDISSGMIEVARRKGFPANVGFQQLDIEESNLPGDLYDRIFCNAVFPHFSDKPKTLLEIHRLLKPGGTLVISHPIGREAVNRLHGDTGGVVANDIIPGEDEMTRLLQGAGFQSVTVIDEPEFYLARGTKPA
jgi:ubiquinone/menaquinone biosynthesis C-methylase UbiE